MADETVGYENPAFKTENSPELADNDIHIGTDISDEKPKYETITDSGQPVTDLDADDVASHRYAVRCETFSFHGHCQSYAVIRPKRTCGDQYYPCI